jgi:hypothetical protein
MLQNELLFQAIVSTAMLKPPIRQVVWLALA